MSLALLAPMLYGVEELRIEACQASQILGVDLVGLAFVGVDELYLARIGNQYLVATLLEHPACPGRVSPSLYCDAQRLLRAKASPEGLGVRAQPTFLHNLTTVLIDEAQVGVLVAEIQSGCHLQLVFANIRHGPILLPFWASEPVEHLQTVRVLRIWGVGLLISSSVTPLPRYRE
jgi:hypothetical protein